MAKKTIVEKITDGSLFQWAAGMTLRPGQKSRLSWAKALQCEHSPIRAELYKVELIGIKTFVSVHLSRHKFGVDHFVQSNRDDRGGDGTETRETPVNHGMIVNAQAMIAISRKRLCLNSHKATVAAWSKVRKAMRDVDPAMADRMVPECVYRNGLCPELKVCKPGPKKVCSAYPPWPGNRG